jgi:hypothetical protein
MPARLFADFLAFEPSLHNGTFAAGDIVRHTAGDGTGAIR